MIGAATDSDVCIVVMLSASSTSDSCTCATCRSLACYLRPFQKDGIERDRAGTVMLFTVQYCCEAFQETSESIGPNSGDDLGRFVQWPEFAANVRS